MSIGMNDDKVQVLFLFRNNLPFVNGAVKSFLEEDGILTGELEIKNCMNGTVGEIPPLVFSDADCLIENPKERAFIFDACIEQGAHLVLLDGPEKIETLKEVTTPALIAETYVRPIDAKEATKRLKKLIETINSRGLRKLIMIVDDSPTFLRTASDWFEDEYNVCVCPSAFTAIKLINVKNPDLILLDYEMPVCSGAQFLEMLNNEKGNNHPPVMFLTSKNDQDTVKELLALKPKGYLLKTQPKESILNSIRIFFSKEN